MNISVRFENPHTSWIPLTVFKRYFEWLSDTQKSHNITYESVDDLIKRNPSGTHSPHIMVITNVDNKKYIIVSYWDRAIELTWSGNGWDDENRVELITSAGVHQEMEYTPFSYSCYSNTFENLSMSERKGFDEKTNDNLIFRGYLYSHRLDMKNYKPNYFGDKIDGYEYFKEINNSKICLSLNGAGEICNRDIEILSCGSVLLRPELSQRFHSPLIPDVHYLAVPKVDNPEEQLDLLIDKYETVINNTDLLRKVAENGYQWYLENGTINSHVEILKRIVDINKLS